MSLIFGWIMKKAWPFLLAGAGAIVMVFLFRQNVQLRVKVKNAETRIKVKGAMQDAVANTRTDRASVIRRLRDSRF